MGREGIIFVFVILMATSCKTTQSFYNRKGELKNISDTKLVNSIEDNYQVYNSVFYKKFNAVVTFDGESKSFKGNLFLQKDSSIIVSINPLMGIELFRVKLSPERVEVIDRTKKKYAVGNYELLWNKFLVELDYYTIQNILLNELYTYPISDADERYIKRYKHYVSNDCYQLKSVKDGRINRIYRKEKGNDLVLHEFSVLPEIFKISKSYIRDFGVNSEIIITYKNFKVVNSHYMPTLTVIDGKRGSREFSMKINFDHIDINGDNSLGFKVSDRYDKINL